MLLPVDSWIPVRVTSQCTGHSNATFLSWSSSLSAPLYCFLSSMVALPRLWTLSLLDNLKYQEIWTSQFASLHRTLGWLNPNRRWYVCCTKHVQHTVSNVYCLLYVCMCGQCVALCTNPRLQLLYYHWENKQDIIEKCSATHDNLVWVAPSDYFELVI